MVNMRELCARCGGRTAAHMHHRKRRSQGGDDSPENLVALCVDCHDWVHRAGGAAYATGWLVASHDDPATVPMQLSPDHPRHAPPESECPEHDHRGNCEVCGVGIVKRVSKPRLKGEERRKRKVITIRVPDDWEDGGQVWDETLEDVKRELVVDGLYEDAERIPNYEAVIAGLRDYVDTRQLVRGYREQ